MKEDSVKASVLDNEPGKPAASAVARFTPGPWRFIEMPSREVLLKRAHWAVGQAHAPAKGVGLAFGETDANARLIAAAPDLYAALEYIFEHIADKERRPRDLYPAFGLDARRAIEMASAALAKAAPPTELVTDRTAQNTDASTESTP